MEGTVRSLSLTLAVDSRIHEKLRQDDNEGWDGTCQKIFADPRPDWIPAEVVRKAQDTLEEAFTTWNAAKREERRKEEEREREASLNAAATAAEVAVQKALEACLTNDTQNIPEGLTAIKTWGSLKHVAAQTRGSRTMQTVLEKLAKSAIDGHDGIPDRHKESCRKGTITVRAFTAPVALHPCVCDTK